MNETLKVLETRRSCRDFDSNRMVSKEEFESDFGKKILADLGIEGDYEGIGHCAIGYAAAPVNAAAARKDNYVYFVE